MPMKEAFAEINAIMKENIKHALCQQLYWQRHLQWWPAVDTLSKLCAHNIKTLFVLKSLDES